MNRVRWAAAGLAVLALTGCDRSSAPPTPKAAEPPVLPKPAERASGTSRAPADQEAAFARLNAKPATMQPPPG
jgi:hypothetical protein